MGTAQPDSRKPSLRSKIRLQRYLAQCGVGSRRACEKLIEDGVVDVDGKTVTQQGVVIDPEACVVCVRGQVVAAERTHYYLLNKPRDVLCTSSDPRGRRTFMDFVPASAGRVYTVGRLDRDSEGLLLITNDGELSARLTHPRYHVEKTYQVWSTRKLSDDDCARFRRGIRSEGEMLKAENIQRVRGREREFVYEVVLVQGKNRQLRRMFTAVGADVDRLVRTRIGPLTIGRLRSGQMRELTKDEVEVLRRSIDPRLQNRRSN